VMKILSVCLLTAALSGACSQDRGLFTTDDANILTVDAILYVGRNFPSIYLTRTQSPEQTWQVGNVVETGATVMIESEIQVVPYVEYTGQPGRYVPRSWAYDIAPQTTYKLTVVTAAGERLTAETTTPAGIDITNWVLLDETGQNVKRELRTFGELGEAVYDAPENQLVYANGLLEALLNPQPTAGFQAGIYSLDLDSGLVIDPEFLDEEDLENFNRNVASPPILPSETNIRLPWFAIYYSGRYKIRIYSVDNNWYDLARTSGLFGGGGFGGNAGDDFEKPIYHVNGGIGIFGSASVDSIGFRVLARPSL
jgi:hypothetical protein